MIDEETPSPPPARNLDEEIATTQSRLDTMRSAYMDILRKSVDAMRDQPWNTRGTQESQLDDLTKIAETYLGLQVASTTYEEARDRLQDLLAERSLQRSEDAQRRAEIVQSRSVELQGLSTEIERRSADIQKSMDRSSWAMAFFTVVIAVGTLLQYCKQ